jgi:hypothetical protein
MIADILYLRGSIPVQYELTLINPSDQPITLEWLEIRTIGSGAYYLQRGLTPIHRRFPPHSSQTIVVSVWGWTRGGFLAASEPVTIRGVAYFDSSSGRFAAMFRENLLWIGRRAD